MKSPVAYRRKISMKKILLSTETQLCHVSYNNFYIFSRTIITPPVDIPL